MLAFVGNVLVSSLLDLTCRVADRLRTCASSVSPKIFSNWAGSEILELVDTPHAAACCPLEVVAPTPSVAVVADMFHWSLCLTSIHTTPEAAWLSSPLLQLQPEQLSLCCPPLLSPPSLVPNLAPVAPRLMLTWSYGPPFRQSPPPSFQGQGCHVWPLGLRNNITWC